MQTDYPLRMYANPVKQFLLLLVSAAFVLIGLLMVRDPNVRADVFTAVMAYAAIIFFGLCTAVFLIAMLRYVVFRRPVLQIDAEEWSYKNPLAGKAQAVTWQNIRAIALCRQKGSRNSVYYLVVYSKKAQPRARAFAERFYPSLSGAAMSVPLNSLFVLTTSTKSKRLLERIVLTCAHEIQVHRVQISTEMHDL